MREVSINETDEIKILISDRVMTVLGFIPKYEKGAPQKVKRLIRIRKNLFRELAALNKEIKRHKSFIKV